jgi:broad specificity phosphatase PhoE
VLLIVRHGETAANAQGRVLGRADPPLTDVGRAQAAALALALPRPDLVVTSPLQRARHTAQAFGVAVQVDERWIELDYGELDGRTIASATGELARGRRGDTSYSPPGGESLASLGARVRNGCESLAERAAADVVVVVTHVSPIKAAIAWALDVADTIAWRMYVEDASVSRIDIESDGPVLRWFNRVESPR